MTEKIEKICSLTPGEQKDLRKLEATIQAGKTAFQLVINAISEIGQRRLYREKYDDFDTYCLKRWGWQTSRFRQFVTAKNVMDTLKPENKQLVENEATARELAKVPPAKRDAVVQHAHKTGKVTSKSVAEAAVVIDVDEVFRDSLGREIPKGVSSYWTRSGEINTVLATLTQIKCALEKSKENGDKMYAEVSNTAIGDLEKARAAIECAKPYAVCTQCQGHPEVQPEGNCRLCYGRGLISKFRWERAVPETTKKLVMKTIKTHENKTKEKDSEEAKA